MRLMNYAWIENTNGHTNMSNNGRVHRRHAEADQYRHEGDESNWCEKVVGKILDTICLLWSRDVIFVNVSAAISSP